MGLNVDPHSPAPQLEAWEDVASDWPPAHPQDPNDTQPGWTTPAPRSRDDGNSSQSLPESQEEYSATVSGSPPPVIVSAFPDHGYEQKRPAHDLDSASIPWPTTVAVVAVCVAVIAVLVAISVAPTRRGGPNPSSTAAPSTTSTVPVTTPPPSTVTVTTAPPTVTVTTVPPTTTAPSTLTVTTRPPAPPAPSVPRTPLSLPQLRAQANIDSAVVTAWGQNQWFPQLSSKQPGTVDDGIRWDYDSIWREHLRLRQQYGAVLLWSGDWPSTFKEPDYWVTIAWYNAFPDADGAREWCQNHGRDSDHCYPTQIQ
jgi:hypothetical protein